MQTNRFLGSVLLVAGISIGAAMLALPAVTAAYGFFPSIGLMLLCWACMTMTGFLILEVNLWFKPGTNILSMAEKTLGFPGKMTAWLTYALLFYALMAAYISGMGELIQSVVYDLFAWKIYNGVGSFVLVFLVSIAVYVGTTSVDHLNRFFFSIKVLTYAAVVFMVAPRIEFSYLSGGTLHNIWLALPVVITSFGFQIIVPGLRVYLNDDVKRLRLALFIGSLITLSIYILWEITILGVVPVDGENGLLAILAGGKPVSGIAESLHMLTNSSSIGWLFRAFTIFAIMTSFIGVSFGLFGYVVDGLQIKRTVSGKLFALVLTFVPGMLFAFFYPHGFVLALGYAGIFVAILLGILPVAMSFAGRRKFGAENHYRPKIGIIKMGAVIAFCVVVIVSQLI